MKILFTNIILRSFMPSALVIIILSSSPVIGADYIPQWENVPSVMLYSLVVEQDGEIVGTDSVLYPDATRLMFQYVKTQKGLFRCQEIHTKSFVETYNACYKLRKWGD